VSLTYAGLCISLYYLAEFCLKMPAGAAVDRVGQRTALTVSMLGSLATLAAIALVRDPVLFAIAVCLHGASAAPIWPSVLSYTADRVDSDKRGSAMGVVFSAWLAGIGLGALTCNVLTGFDLLARFGLLGAVWVLAMTVALLLVRRPATDTGRGAGQPHPPAWSTFREVVGRLARKPLLVAGLFLQTFSLGMLVPVIKLYSQEEVHLEDWQVTVLMLAGGGLALALMVPMGRIADRMSKRILLIAGLLVAGICVALLPVLRSFAGLLIMVGIGGAAYATILPTWNAMLLRHAPRDKRALMLSAFMAMEQCGIASAPVVSATLWDSVGRDAPFITSGAIVVTMAGLYVLFPSVFRGDPDAVDLPLEIVEEQPRVLAGLMGVDPKIAEEAPRPIEPLLEEERT
jgi:MFS family permease